MRVLAVCGSLQKKSGNLSLLQTAAAIAPAGVQVQLYDGLGDLPHFNPDLDLGEAPPRVGELRAAVARSDALLIASPEYGHSLPGALKNAIDWLIGSGELERKLVAITCAVPIAERGQLGLKALADTLGAVSARIAYARPIARGAGFESEIAEVLRALTSESRDA